MDTVLSMNMDSAVRRRGLLGRSDETESVAFHGRKTSRRSGASCWNVKVLSAASAVVALVWLLQAPFSLSSLSQTHELIPGNEGCRYFLAESAIPNGGLGLFAGIDVPKGSLAQSMLDICIYVTDTPDKTQFETHSWARDVFNGIFE